MAKAELYLFSNGCSQKIAPEFTQILGDSGNISQPGGWSHSSRFIPVPRASASIRCGSGRRSMRALRSGKACRSLTAFAIGPRSRDHAAFDKLFNKPQKE